MTHRITTVNNLQVVVIVVRIVREDKLILDELLGCIDPILIPLVQAEVFELETRMKNWLKLRQ
jgi:hypothetical protein